MAFRISQTNSQSKGIGCSESRLCTAIAICTGCGIGRGINSLSVTVLSVCFLFQGFQRLPLSGKRLCWALWARTRGVVNPTERSLWNGMYCYVIMILLNKWHRIYCNLSLKSSGQVRFPQILSSSLESWNRGNAWFDSREKDDDWHNELIQSNRNRLSRHIPIPPRRLDFQPAQVWAFVTILATKWR